MNTSYSFEHDLANGKDVDAFKSMVKFPTEKRQFSPAVTHRAMYQCVGAVTHYAAEVMKLGVKSCRVAVMFDMRDGYETVHISPAVYADSEAPAYQKVKTLDAELLAACIKYLQVDMPYEVDLWFKLDGSALKVHFFVTKKPMLLA